MKIALGCDHGGLNLKNEILNYLKEEGMEELTPDNTYVQKEGDKYYMIYKNDKDEISKEDAEEMKMSGFEVKENEER